MVVHTFDFLAEKLGQFQQNHRRLQKPQKLTVKQLQLLYFYLSFINTSVFFLILIALFYENYNSFSLSMFGLRINYNKQHKY